MPEPKTLSVTPCSPAASSACCVTVELLDHSTPSNEPRPGSCSAVEMEIHVAATAPMTIVPTMTMALRSA